MGRKMGRKMGGEDGKEDGRGRWGDKGRGRAYPFYFQ